jgi:Holliday junction resolvase RusA-like endonuclease
MWKGRYLLSAEGRAYKEYVHKVLPSFLGKKYEPLKGRLKIYIGLSRYDKREYDIDNFVKGLLDALKGEVFVDDRQIDKLITERLPVTPGGYANILIEYSRPYRKKTVKRRVPNPKKQSEHQQFLEAISRKKPVKKGTKKRRR